MKLPKFKNYPKKVYVKDEVYEIKMVSRIPDGPKTDLGLCDDDTKTIWIRKNQSPKGLFRTFLHEILHAMEYEWKIKLKHKTVYQLEEALEAFFSDNFVEHK